FARKYRTPVTVAAAFALLLVAGVLVSAWQAVQATDSEREATRKREEAEAAQERARAAEAKAIEEAEWARRQWYAATMGVVQAAWESHNILLFHDLLADTGTFPERCFEWYYWQRLYRVEHPRLLGHKGRVTAVAFAPNGQWLGTGGTDGTARVWD